MKTLWGREPILFTAVIQAALGVLTAFGTALTAQQIAAILTLSGTILAVIARSQVTPSK